MRPWMRREDRRVVAVLGFLPGLGPPDILSIPIFLLAWPLGMGRHGVGGSLVIAAGPAFVGATWAFGWSWRSVAGLLVIPGLVALTLLFVARFPSELPAPALGSSRSPRPLWSRSFAFILLVYMFAGFAYQGGLTFLPRFVGAGPFALALALGAIGQVVSGRLADRRQSQRILFGLSVAAATILVLLAVLPPGGAFTTAALLFGFLLFSLEPLQNILVTGEVPGPLRGLAFGFTFLSVFGIGSLGAALAGWLIANHASAILFLVLGGFLAASGTASLGVRRRFNA